jgi:anti-anti-sigma factor
MRAVVSLKILPSNESSSLRLVGELDISNVDEVQARLEEELRPGNQLTLDTTELSFMDSQGLRMLIELGSSAQHKGSSIRLLNCSRAVQRVLDTAVPDGIPGVEIFRKET